MLMELNAAEIDLVSGGLRANPGSTYTCDLLGRYEAYQTYYNAVEVSIRAYDAVFEALGDADIAYETAEVVFNRQMGWD